MAETEYPLTRDDFENSKWEEAITSAPKKEYFYYCMEIRKKLDEAIKAKDESATAVFKVLYIVTDIELRPDDASQPFSMKFATAISRTAQPCDISDEHYKILRELAPGVLDPEMRARLCDLVWSAKRGDHELARLAIKSYLESAKTLENVEHWLEFPTKSGHRVKDYPACSYSAGET